MDWARISFREMELLLVSLVKELLLEEERERDLRWKENGCGKRRVECCFRD